MFKIVDEYTFIDNIATNIVEANNTSNDTAISPFVAVFIIILRGILKGDDIGTMPAILFILLLGFIIEKYAK